MIPPDEPSCLIRRALPGDAAAIQSLYDELLGPGKSRILREQISALDQASGSFLLVAETGGTVCATALLTICPDVMHGTQPFGVVENVVVAAEMRGRGLGHLLFSHMEKLAAEYGCTKLMLMSGTHRHEAHAFFRRCGYSGDAKQAFVKYRSRFSDRTS